MSKTILTVDDSKTMRDMVSFTLRQAGYNVVEAADGQAALDLLADMSVDCIVTDLNMPQVDGIELIRHLRARSGYRSTPILMLTTEGDDAKKLEGRQAGATGWLVKPFNPERLVDVVRKVCP